MTITASLVPAQSELASSPLIEDLTPGMATPEAVPYCFCDISRMD